MAKKKNSQPYFPHEANTRNRMPVIQLRIDLGAEGYGVYIMLLERLRVAENFREKYDLDTLAFDFRADTSVIERVICSYGLFETVTDDDGNRAFYSPELSESLGYMVEQQKRRAEAGRKASAARWGRQSTDSPAPQLPGLDVPVEDDGKGADDTAPDVTLDTEAQLMLLDRDWLMTLADSHGLEPDSMEDRLKEFVKWCRCEGYLRHIDQQDACSHFNRWLGKQNQGAIPSPVRRKAPGVSMAESDQRREESRREYEEHRKSCVSANEYIRSKGYDPTVVTMAQVMNPEWCAANPPLQLQL